MRGNRSTVREKRDVRRTMVSHPNQSTVVISQRGAARLKAGHVWVYRSDVVSADSVSPGATVQITDERGRLYGSALYSTSSQIAVRMISDKAVSDLPALVRERIRAAIRYREGLVYDTDAYRVVFSEGAFLPGLIVGRYHDILSVQ